MATMVANIEAAVNFMDFPAVILPFYTDQDAVATFLASLKLPKQRRRLQDVIHLGEAIRHAQNSSLVEKSMICTYYRWEV